jgi:hypothetical protein
MGFMKAKRPGYRAATALPVAASRTDIAYSFGE